MQKFQRQVRGHRAIKEAMTRRKQQEMEQDARIREALKQQKRPLHPKANFTNVPALEDYYRSEEWEAVAALGTNTAKKVNLFTGTTRPTSAATANLDQSRPWWIVVAGTARRRNKERENVVGDEVLENM